MLNGKKILIVEDEAILALDLAFAMEDLGASVCGPYHRLRTALDGAEQPIDGAILDVDLAGEQVFPLADTLRARNIPIVFHSGRQNPEELVSRYSGYDLIRICPKPTAPQRVAEELSALLSLGEGRLH